MAQTKLRDTVVNLSGELPAIGSTAPGFTLTGNDLVDQSMGKYSGKNIILNIFPSIDTGVCALSVRQFNQKAAGLKDTVVLCVSKDLPFAFKRFCGAEGIENVVTLSGFRHASFGSDYGVEMIDGGMSGLFARSVVVIDQNGKVLYTELVPAIGQEPDYDSALAALSF